MSKPKGREREPGLAKTDDNPIEMIYPAMCLSVSPVL